METKKTPLISEEEFKEIMKCLVYGLQYNIRDQEGFKILFAEYYKVLKVCSKEELEKTKDKFIKTWDKAGYIPLVSQWSEMIFDYRAWKKDKEDAIKRRKEEEEREKEGYCTPEQFKEIMGPIMAKFKNGN